VADILSSTGKLSLTYHNLRLRNKQRLRDLSSVELRTLSNFIDRNYFNQLNKAIESNVGDQVLNRELCVMIRGRLIDLRKLCSKSLREYLYIKEPICTFKFGSILSPTESLNWGNALRKVTSVRHRSTLLRVAHGDIYTKSKLYNFGLSQSPNCTNCGDFDNLQHKFFDCPYSKAIWDVTLGITDRLKPVNSEPSPFIENRILGQSVDTTPLILTIHAEVLLRILAISDSQNFRLRPNHLVKLVLKCVSKREVNQFMIDQCNDLLALI
jgi:hypothetical protein